jgi:hypothetical protein
MEGQERIIRYISVQQCCLNFMNYKAMNEVECSSMKNRWKEVVMAYLKDYSSVCLGSVTLNVSLLRDEHLVDMYLCTQHMALKASKIIYT